MIRCSEKIRFLIIFLLMGPAFLSIPTGCDDNSSTAVDKGQLSEEPPTEKNNPSNPDVQQSTPVFTYRVVNDYPHDPEAFTQGLIYHNGILYEGTGLYGKSSLRRVDLETGKVIQKTDLPKNRFGEGIVVFNDYLYQLTWRSGIGYIYDPDSLRIIDEFRYSTEGWGLTHDGKKLIRSDGSPVLHFHEPETFKKTGGVNVFDENGPVAELNELEYINGEIYANVWRTDRIARIDPHTGKVIAWIDLTGIQDAFGFAGKADVLNGVAYDSFENRLFVTGKLWPRIFEIELELKE